MRALKRARKRAGKRDRKRARRRAGKEQTLSFAWVFNGNEAFTGIFFGFYEGTSLGVPNDSYYFFNNAEYFLAGILASTPN